MVRFLLGAAVALGAAYGLIHFGIVDLAGAKAAGAERQETISEDAGWIGDADEIRGHLEFLADDLLEGREAGSRGYDIAALYAANHFASLGLKPGGDDGGYMQNVPLREVNADFSASRFSLRRNGAEDVFAPQEDFVMGGRSAQEESSVTAAMVFVGFGVEAPEFGVNSYEGVDAEGKIVVYLAGGPPQLPAEERAHFGSHRNQGGARSVKGRRWFSCDLHRSI